MSKNFGASDTNPNDPLAAGVQRHLGQKLRDLFESEQHDPLPDVLMKLLAALEASSTKRANDPATKTEMLALVPTLRRFAYSLCGNRERSDDLVQETILKAWSHLDSFQHGTNLRAWLFTILRNTYLSELRKQRKEVEDVEGKMAERLSVAPAQQGHIDLQDLRKALEHLPPSQREAVMMVCAEGLSYEEVAEIAGCAVGTIKSRVNRARLKLADILGITESDQFQSEFATLL